MDEPGRDEQRKAATSEAPRPVLPVLSYEKPILYRYRSDLPPPGLIHRLFCRCCYATGRLLGLVYRPRPER